MAHFYTASARQIVVTFPSVLSVLMSLETRFIAPFQRPRFRLLIDQAHERLNSALSLAVIRTIFPVSPWFRLYLAAQTGSCLASSASLALFFLGTPRLFFKSHYLVFSERTFHCQYVSARRKWWVGISAWGLVCGKGKGSSDARAWKNKSFERKKKLCGFFVGIVTRKKKRT